jgi:hypothetical protein
MGAMLGYLLIGLIVLIAATQICAMLSTQFGALPRWLPLILTAVVMGALICAPLGSQATVQVFRQLNP